MTDLRREWLWDWWHGRNLDHGQREKGDLRPRIGCAAVPRGEEPDPRCRAAERVHRLMADGPMPSHLFSAHCSDGSIVSKHWRRRQRDGCQTVQNPAGLRPVLLLDGRHRGVMEQMATLHLHATVEMTDVPRIVEDDLDRVNRFRSAPVPCMWRRDGERNPSMEVLVLRDVGESEAGALTANESPCEIAIPAPTNHAWQARASHRPALLASGV